MKKYRIWLAVLLIGVLAFGGCGGFNGSGKARQQSREQDSGETSEKEELPEEKEQLGSEESSEENNASENGELPEGSNASENPESLSGQETAAPALNEETVVRSREEVVTTSSVNIRTAPSTGSEVYQTAVRRTELLRTANDGTWSAVEIDGREYYVAS